MQTVLLDSTLREGELFRLFPRETKVRLANKLVEAGINRIELTVDYPPRTTIEDTMPIVRSLKKSGAMVVIHGRATPDDIEAMAKYDVEGCAVYIAISKLHRKYKLHGISRREALERLAEAVRMAKERGFRYIRATVEDASRIYLEDGKEGLLSIKAITQKLERCGATVVSLPDTSGLLTPRTAADFFRKMKRLSALPLAAHFHNDYGFASANTIEAALEGVEEVHVSVMGIGDRNGIADLYEVSATLEDVYEFKTGIKRAALKKLYGYFCKFTGIEISWRHPLSEEARTVRAGVHQSMTVRRHEGYIPYKKLVNDFGEPIYGVGPYISHNLVLAMLTPHLGSIDPQKAREIAEELARSAQASKLPYSLRNLQRVIRAKAGVEIPYHELTRFFGGERVYILLKLLPQYPARELAEKVLEWEDVDGVDEVYGDVDMVIRARTAYHGDNVVTRLRQSFPDALQDLRVLVTD